MATSVLAAPAVMTPGIVQPGKATARSRAPVAMMIALASIVPDVALIAHIGDPLVPNAPDDGARADLGAARPRLFDERLSIADIRVQPHAHR